MDRGGSSSGGVIKPAGGFGWVLALILVAAAVGAAAAAAREGTPRLVVECGGALVVLLVGAISVVAARRGRVQVEQRNRYARQEAAWRQAAVSQEQAFAERSADQEEAFTRRLAEREADWQRVLGDQQAMLEWLAHELLPQAVARLKKGELVEEVLTAVAEHLEGHPAFHTSHKALLRSVLEAVSEEEKTRDASQRAFVNIARRVQAIVHQTASDLRAMEMRYGGDTADEQDRRIYQDLLALDLNTTLIGRFADGIAVLGGEHPGKQWTRAVPLYSVLRGAMSQTRGYERVDLEAVPDVAVDGSTVQPLIHTFAELMDNATRFSPPHTRVKVAAFKVHAGIAVEIEDGGSGLSESKRAQAERLLDGRASIDVNDLSKTPQLGLAVVGRHARTYGLKVTLKESAYAGVRATVLVPREHLTEAPATGVAHGIGALAGGRDASDPGKAQAASVPSQPRLVAGPRRSVPVAPQSGGEGPTVPMVRSSGLPQRIRSHPAPVPRATSGRGAASPGDAVSAQRRVPGESGTASAPPVDGLINFLAAAKGEDRPHAARNPESVESLDEDGKR